jgi:hypothetical protein
MKRNRTINYRKIYAQNYGPIGKDSEGRSLEVHHIDGNHTNNDLSNLTLVTIKEHYDIHYAQKDYVACFLMAKRMNLSPEELSALAKKNTQVLNQKRLLDGTHNFLDSKSASQWNQARVEKGTHILLGGAVQQKSIANGTHGSKIMVSCLECKKTVNIGVYARLHKHY